MAGMGIPCQLLQHALAGKLQALLKAPALGLLGVERLRCCGGARGGGRFYLLLDRLALPAAGHLLIIAWSR